MTIQGRPPFGSSERYINAPRKWNRTCAFTNASSACKRAAGSHRKSAIASSKITLPRGRSGHRTSPRTSQVGNSSIPGSVMSENSRTFHLGNEVFPAGGR